MGNPVLMHRSGSAAPQRRSISIFCSIIPLVSEIRRQQLAHATEKAYSAPV